MTAWLAVVLALLPGWGVARLRGGRGARLVSETIVWGLLATVLWIVLLDLLGVRWSPAALAIPAAAGAVAGAAARLRGGLGSFRPTGWHAVAAAAAGVHAALLASTPSFGWDFRFSWALKAKVYALAGGHDLAWLAWPYHAFARVDYPPLWTDLLACGIVLGADPGATSAAWHAVFAVGLAATCWEVASPAPAPVRALAAAAGAWAPVMFTPTVAYSGYAEPLLSCAACAALGALAAVSRGEKDAWAIAAAGAALAALTKNEGMALGLGVAVASWRLGGRRAVAAPAAVLAAVAGWRLALASRGIEGFSNVFGADRAGSRLLALPASFAEIGGPGLFVLAAVFAVAAAGLVGPDLRGARAALAVWGGAVVAAYLVSPFGLAWHLQTSLDRVLAVPLPFMLAAGLRCARPWARGGARRAPDSAPGG